MVPRSEDRGGTTIQNLCEMIHKSLLREFQYALVWGTSSKHTPQRCAALTPLPGAGPGPRSEQQPWRPGRAECSPPQLPAGACRPAHQRCPAHHASPAAARPRRRCGLSHRLEDEDVVQVVKRKVQTGDDARGRFSQQAKEYVRTVDRVKKAALKT
jgi:hypothetical protein